MKMKELTAVCKNPWCKATFTYTENDIVEKDGKKIRPTICHKCHSFDCELSGGVSWEERTYEGDPWQGAHSVKYKVTTYK
jgi:hypothetical protein